MKKLIVVLLGVCLFSGSAYAYGPRGHKLVGAIADKRLAKNQPIASKVKNLMDGLPLSIAANLPDNIKDWDSCRKGGPLNHAVSGSARINQELRDFLNANLCNQHPSHHEFHYTDVPVAGNEDYDDGTIGRSEFDIVRMLPFCIRVLKGQEPQPNSRRITKTVAVILITHYLGDIHQPLHVGAEYFDANGQPFEPTTANKGFGDQGGNKLKLFTLRHGQLVEAGKLHGYWDGQTVENAFTTMADTTVAKRLAAEEPLHWRLQGGVETWAEQMANEIMPLAREAHSRLVFKEIDVKAGEKEIRSGKAEENKKPGQKFYAVWASEVVRDEIHKAGWRLAAILEEALQ